VGGSSGAARWQGHRHSSGRERRGRGGGEGGVSGHEPKVAVCVAGGGAREEEEGGT
jgi:hypothetical protein